MLQKIVINSESTGKFYEQTINDRPHLVTSMISIEGDSVMNGLFYPAHEVIGAHNQLSRLPAPAGHPVVDGVMVSAKDPAAVNAHNIGGMVLNPRVEGKQVVNDLAFDIAVAEKDERGVEAIRRIRNGERIGVSTGLNADILNVSGKHEDKDYRGILSNLKFDHVAVLLDEAPAGDKTYTVNSDKSVMICNVAESVNELRDDVRDAAQARFGSGDAKYIWVSDILLSPSRAIIEITENNIEKLLMVPFGYNDGGDIVFTGEGVEVERTTSFNPVGNSADNNEEEDDMDKEKLVLSIIGNSSNAFTGEDKDALMSMSENDLVNSLVKKTFVPISVDKATEVLAKEGLTVNKKDFDADGYASFVANKEGFDAYLASIAEKRTKQIEGIVANSKMTAESLAKLDDTELNNLAASFSPENDFSAQGGITTNAEKAADEVDYS
ncbi:MAG: DUF2213 domain-containing protein [Desulfuromonadales bacterium]|nr:DUF2213 domain-containing protein [Desulfuromonadales bacterium]